MIKAIHAFNFGKCDKVTILKSVSSLIQSGNQSVRINVSDYASNRIFPCCINHCKVLAEIHKSDAKEPERVCHHNVNTVLMAIICNNQLIFEWNEGQDDNLELTKQVKV